MLIRNFALMTCALMAVATISEAAPKYRKHTLVAASAMEVAPSDSIVASKKEQKAQWKKAREEKKQERRKAHLERKKARFEARKHGQEKKIEHAKGRALGLKKQHHFGGKPLVVDAATKFSVEEQDGTKEKPFATLDQALAKAQKRAQKAKNKQIPARIILNSGTYLPQDDKEAFDVQAPLSLTIICHGDVTIAKPIRWTAEKTNI